MRVERWNTNHSGVTTGKQELTFDGPWWMFSHYGTQDNAVVNGYNIIDEPINTLAMSRLKTNTQGPEGGQHIAIGRQYSVVIWKWHSAGQS